MNLGLLCFLDLPVLELAELLPRGIFMSLAICVASLMSIGRLLSSLVAKTPMS